VLLTGMISVARGVMFIRFPESAALGLAHSAANGRPALECKRGHRHDAEHFAYYCRNEGGIRPARTANLPELAVIESPCPSPPFSPAKPWRSLP
jgi:hypothetical protein